LNTVANFSVSYSQALNADHQLVGDLPDFAKDNDTLIELYRAMMFTRVFDAKAVALQRTGKLGTFPSSLGQEAIYVAMGHAMNKDDVLCPYYRDQGTFFMRGVSPAEIFRYWGGDERGSNFANNPEDFPLCVPIAQQALHATGVAFAIKHRKQERAVVTTIGEGGTSEGDYYEALNLAGDWNLPCVFVVNNNQWAISVPRDEQTHCQTIAQKAIAAGFDGVQVDGNDVIATTAVIDQALKKARAGGGPTLVEAITYRLCDHTTADDASRYADQTRHHQAEAEEPVKRLRAYLTEQGAWSDEKETALLAEFKQTIETAVAEYINTPKAPKTDMIDYMYAELPFPMQEQYDEIAMLEKENA
jgi:pyruvate dehydrogenase E1 component alpha subunit